VQAVRFGDGERVEADLVVMAAGVRPNVELAQAAGLHVERAIVVDDTLQTYDPRVYAVGECVQHRRSTFGLVAPIWDQARVCAAHLAGHGHRRYVQQATATKLKVTGVDLYSAGDIVGGEGTEDLVLRDRRGGVYKRLVVAGNRLTGAVLYGDVLDGPWYFELIQKRTDISAMRDQLLFGQALCMAA
jgi:nitrite reductase (NADH) large subunit